VGTAARLDEALALAGSLEVDVAVLDVNLNGTLSYPVAESLQTRGVAFIFATWTVFFRDVRHLLEVALAMLFWATPIVYELRQVPERLRLLLLLSPMSPFVVAYQQIFFYREWPDATVWLVAVALALGAFVVGALVFLAYEDALTEQL